MNMARSDRFFEIIQILRAADAPIKAACIAEMLEVSKRTVYRDIATLQAMRTPIYGEAGIGYVMRHGYDLPPINFDVDEAEAITIGLSMIARTGDAQLLAAAKRAARKLSEAAPQTNRLIASSWGANCPEHVDPHQIRQAIRSETKLQISYLDVKGTQSNRTIWPLIMIYYADNTMLVAWCELRNNFRHFRLDRMEGCTETPKDFTGKGAALRKTWEENFKSITVDTIRVSP
jgi:predicted DNA-binding transcriptional regulator YafY